MPRFKTSREALLVASNEPEIQHLLRDAMGQMTPDELASLPDEARFALLDREADVHTAAVTLLQCDLKHRGEQGIGELLRQIGELYACASVRLSQIRHRFQAPG